MPSLLQQELRQQKPFHGPEHEAWLSIERTAAVLRHALGEALKPFDVTPTQINVLRILRGAGPDGLCRYEIGDRLVTQVPDVTRLLDRMEAAGLVARRRNAADRRLVSTHLTEAGRAAVDRLDEPLADLHARQMARLTPDQAQTLVDLLALVRHPAPE